MHRRSGWIWPALLAGSVAGCQTTPSATENPPEAAGVVEATTDESGIAVLTDGDGASLLEVELREADGTPLAGIDAAYFRADPPLLAFTVAETGNAAGTFLVEESGSAQGVQSASGTPVGIFVLSLLDPTLGHLYDPLRDGFTPSRNGTLSRIRSVLSLEDILLVATSTPGLEDKGIFTKGELIEKSVTSVRVFQGMEYAEPLLARIALFTLFSKGQDDSYRYHNFMYADRIGFLLPLGVAAPVAIREPVSGARLTDPLERTITVTGSIGAPPALISSDGGRVELLANGASFSDVLAVGGDGTGNGSEFTTTAPLELPEGETTIEVRAYISEPNRGLETEADGLAGKAVLDVSYEPAGGPHPPVLSNLDHAATAPCPTGEVSVAFHFRDADGDVAVWHQRITGSVQGDPIDEEDDIAVADIPGLACMRESEGDCTAPLRYWGTDGGDWARYEFWITDATGLDSNHLVAYVTITGDCSSGAAPGMAGVR